MSTLESYEDPAAAEVPHPLDEAAVDARAQQAVAAFDEASDLDELKAARLAHTGERSPIALANSRIRDLENAQKKQAGKILGGAKGRVQKALAARTEVLEAEHAARILEEEAVDVTAAPRRRPLGARHPLSVLQEDVSDVFTAMGWEIAEGPEVESEWFNFDALNIAPDHPPARCRTPSTWSPRTGTWSCAPTRRRCRSGRCSPASCPSMCSAPGRRSELMSSTRLTPPSSISSKALPWTEA